MNEDKNVINETKAISPPNRLDQNSPEDTSKENNYRHTTLIETLKQFDALDFEHRKKVVLDIRHDWHVLYNEFRELISKNPELAEKIKSLRLIKSKNGPIAGDYFEKYYGFDPISGEPDYVYDEDLHKESQYLYEKWKKVESDFKKELSRLETGIFIPNRKKRIEVLKKRFEACAEKAENYKRFFDDTNTYNYYMSKPDEIPYLRYAIRDQISSMSREFLDYALNSNPKLICYQSEVGAEDWEYYPQFMCAEMRDALLKELEQEKSSPAQPGENE